MKKGILIICLAVMLMTAGCGNNKNEDKAFDKTGEKLTNATTDDVSLPAESTLIEEKLQTSQTSIAFLNSKGELYIWGSNQYGELGNGEREQFKDTDEPYKVMDNVKDFYLGEHCCSAISFEDELYVWGWNTLNCLSDSSEEYFLKPVKILDNIKYFDNKQYTSAAITTDGDLLMWGVNGDNECGIDNGEEIITTPTKVLENVKCVDQYNNCTVAVTENDELYVWGYNSLRFSDILGTKDNIFTVNHLTPKQVLTHYFSDYGNVSSA